MATTEDRNKQKKPAVATATRGIAHPPAASSYSSGCPHRCWISDLDRAVDEWREEREAVPSSPLSVRVMGTVVSVFQTEDSLESTMASMVLDDGTGLAAITTSLDMIRSLGRHRLRGDTGTGDDDDPVPGTRSGGEGSTMTSLCPQSQAPKSSSEQMATTGAVGKTIDCIARVVVSNTSSENNRNRNRDRDGNIAVVGVWEEQELRADQLVVVEDVHAETLRCLELCHASRQGKVQDSLPSLAGTSHDSLVWGYPRREVRQEDIYELIRSESSSCAAPAATAAHAAENSISGLSVEDLATVLSLDPAVVFNMIQDLQLSGQVYRNQRGMYVPL